jgi:phosphatidate cytidylyltransferase
VTTVQRLFDARLAFESPITAALVGIIVGLVALGLLLPPLLHRLGWIGRPLRDEVVLRSRSWVILAGFIGVPILLGAAWTMAGLFALAILCYAEFARATGLFRNHRVSAAVLLSLGFVFVAVVDHWYGAFAASAALGAPVIAGIALTADRPDGYIQRVALGVFGFLLIGVGLAHWAYLANDADYRPILLTLLVAVQLNDVFAFVCGKAFGRRKLLPVTSPGKTRAGAVGAVLLSTTLVYLVGGFYLNDGFTRYAPHLLGLGVLLSVTGQLGDLMLSSVKRDLGIKDMGVTIPGHGGLLDRFDSLLLTGPAVFHYLAYFRGVGENQPPHVLTGPLLGLPGRMPLPGIDY